MFKCVVRDQGEIVGVFDTQYDAELEFPGGERHTESVLSAVVTPGHCDACYCMFREPSPAESIKALLDKMRPGEVELLRKYFKENPEEPPPPEKGMLRSAKQFK